MPPNVSIPPGRWAVAVSGGADSVALARLAAATPGCGVVIAHLDHQLRGDASDADARFVAALGRRLGVPVEIGRRDAVEPAMRRPPANPQARYRAARLVWFARVVRRHGLDGVLLAHHADDAAETVLLRLLRGSGGANLGGIRGDQTFACVGRMFGVEEDASCPRPWPLRVVRPLIGVRRAALRDYLHGLGQPWREDASNASPAYRRNAVRQVLAATPGLTPLLLELAAASDRLRRALVDAAPKLAPIFDVDQLRVAAPLAERAAMAWLVARGVPPGRVSPAVCRRLIAQATDAVEPCRQHYPGGVLVRRRQKRVDVLPSPPVQSPQPHGQETAPTADVRTGDRRA